MLDSVTMSLFVLSGKAKRESDTKPANKSDHFRRAGLSTKYMLDITPFDSYLMNLSKKMIKIAE